MVKKILIIFLFIGYAQFQNAQTYIGGHFIAGQAGAFVKAKSGYANNSINEHNDSINNIQKMIFAPGFGIHVSQRLKRFDEIYFGLRYQVYGWGRKRTNLVFNDSLHTDIGKVLAIGPAGDMEYYYRFHNISVPFYFFHTVKWERMPKGMNFGLYGGGALNLVVSKKAKAKSIGFSAYNKKEFDLPTDQFDLLPINLSLQAGVRMRQDLGDNYFFSFMPGFSFIPTPSSNQYERQFQYRINATIGISKAFK